MRFLKMIIVILTIRAIEIVNSEPTMVTIKCDENDTNGAFYSCTALGANGAKITYLKRRKYKF